MVRRMLLGAIGCAVLGLFACSENPDPEVAERRPATDEPVLTAPGGSERDSPTEGPVSPVEEEEMLSSFGETEQPTLEAPDPFAQPSSEAVADTTSPPATQETEQAAVDAPPVQSILEQVVAFYREVDSVKVTAELSEQVTDDAGTPLPFPAAPPLVRRLTLQRPNLFSAVVDGGGAPAVVSNGETVTAYFEATEMFLSGAAPPVFSGLSETEIGLTVAFAGPFQMATFRLMSDDPQRALTSDVKQTEYVALDDVDETPAHRLRFNMEQTTPRGIREVVWDMWVASEGDPLVLQTAIIQDQQSVMIQGQGRTTLTFWMVEKLHSWELNPELTDDAFVAAVPDSAREARDVLDLFEPSLLGRAAPDVTLPVVGSEDELSLAALQDTSVVILDFWATWCGPCRDAMPVLDEVAREYQDRGVAVYAVNIEDRDTDEQIQEFLDSEGLSLRVARDAGAATASAFGVSSIPHSVIIGRNGLVQAVHVGFSPDLGGQVRRELDALLDGQDIFDGLPAEATEESGQSADAVDSAESTETPAGDAGESE